MRRSFIIAPLIIICQIFIYAQSGTDDFWLNNGFISGDTVYINSGWFYDDGGSGLYHEDQDWDVTFCSENGSPLTIDFSNFRTHFGGIIGDGTFEDYDYITVDYPGASYVAYHNNTPEFSFTSQSTCISLGFISNADGQVDSGWVAEIFAMPAPENNDPSDAEVLIVGNICSPSFYSNKGAFNTTNLGSPPCQTYFGGDVWFRAVVPASGVLKIETFEGTLDYAIMDIYNSPDANLDSTERIACIDEGGAMPSVILAAPMVDPGDVVYIRLFGEQAKSGLFGICASDPTAPVTGFVGPGGVGDSVSIDYWFKPETGILNNSDGVASNNESVRTWKDQSGNEQHLIQGNESGQPVFISNAQNDLAAVQFDGTDDVFELESGSGDAPLHWFAAGSFTGSHRQTMVSVGDAFADKTASISRDSDGSYFSFSNVDLVGPPLTEGKFYIFNASHRNTAPFHFLELDGQPQTVNPEALPLETNGTFRMGASWDGAEPFGGRVSELIQYRKSLNLAQEIIVNNYLSAKYNIPLVTNDFYPYKTSFQFDVAGIGRVDADNTHTKAMSAKMLSVSGADDFDDYEFLFLGHNNGDAALWSTTGLPAGDTNIVRMERVWRVALTGSPGEVTMSLDKNNLPELPGGFVAYNLLVDADGDFSTGAKSYGPYEINNALTVNNLPIADGDYISIAAVRPVISFAAESTFAFESVANPVLEVLLNYPISTVVEVSYEVTEGTASPGEDYSLVASSILIEPGNSNGQIIPLIIDDDIPEIPDEYFTVQISTTTEGVETGSFTNTKHVIQNDDLEVELQATDTVTGACSSSVAELIAYAKGTGPFTYEWTPSTGLNNTENDTVTANPEETTRYKVMVTDAYGLIKSKEVTVYVYPSPAQPVITTEGPTTFCEGDSTVLSVPGGQAVYLWSTGDTTNEISVSTSGDYSITVADSFGCISPVSAEISVTVIPVPEQPVVTPSGEQFLITGDSLLLTSSPADAYHWSPGGAGTRSLYVSASGEYSVVVENELGCLSAPSEIVPVRVSNFLPPPEITVGGALSFCAGGNVILSGPEGYEDYTWSNGATGSEVIVSSAGTITLVVTNEKGVQSHPSEEVEVIVHELPELTIEDLSLPLCSGDENGTVTVNAEGGLAPYNFTWIEQEENTTTLSGLSAGTYRVQVEDSRECRDTLEVQLAEPDPLYVEYRTTDAYCPDQSDGIIELTLMEGGTSPYEVTWTGGGTGEYLSDLSSGEYEFSVIDANGCIFEGIAEVKFNREDCFIVPEIITPNQDGYNDTWKIEGLELYPDVTLEVYDRWGRRVFYSEGHDTYFNGTFDGKDLPMESYHYVIDLHNGTERIIGNLTIIR